MLTLVDNKSLLIQCAHTMPVFVDMNRLTYQRHIAYCSSHGFDFWNIYGNPEPHKTPGGWDKIFHIKRALADGYEFVVWMDTDAAVVRDVSLTEALPKTAHIGGCLHPPNERLKIESHVNVGVLYFRNTDETRSFVNAWEASWPAKDPRWQEQGAFNDLSKSSGIVSVIDNKWNSTYQVTEVPDPVVMAWHGSWPLAHRLDLMREYFRIDYLKYRV